MKTTERLVLLVVAEASITQELIGELLRSHRHYQLPIAANLAQARARLRHLFPLAILLDESAVDDGCSSRGALTLQRASAQSSPPFRVEQASGGCAREGAEPSALFSAVVEFTRVAPAIVLASAERQPELAPLTAAGDVDYVARAGPFVPMAAALIERRVRLSELSEAMLGSYESSLPASSGAEALGNFGEILRHEVNNPLTGILGNAELLLARRDQLPPSAVHRIETIAGLAVRLRETVRRLSNAWKTHPEQNRAGLSEPVHREPLPTGRGELRRLTRASR